MAPCYWTNERRGQSALPLCGKLSKRLSKKLNPTDNHVMDVLATPASPKAGESLSPATTILRKTFSFPVLLGVMLVVGVFVAAYLRLSSPPPAGEKPIIAIFEGDTWFHILVGEDILKTHTFPTTDSYSFTAYGNECMAFEWLGQILMALTARWGGLRALTALTAGLTSALLLLLYYYASLRCGNSKAAFVACLPMLPITLVFFTLRPQLLGYIFLLITMICLEHFRRGRTWALWALPLLFVLWANTHGSFMLGLFVLGFYWAAGLVRFQAGRLFAEPWTLRQRLQIEVVLLLSVLALTATPYGTRLVGFTLHVLLHARLGMTYIMEYFPLNDGLLKVFVVLLLAFLVAQVVLQPSYRLEELGLLMVTVYGAFVHSRLVLFWVPVFTPLLATLLARWVPAYERAKDKYVLNAVLIALAALGLVKFFPLQQELEGRVADAFPQGAVEYLKQHPVSGRMFNDGFWGAYLIRSLGHQHKVFIDGRSQLFEDAGVLNDYLHIIAVDHDTVMLLRKYGVEACLIERQAPLATLLNALPDWQQVYADKLSVLFLRRSH
jgi:hypothetical protein